MFTVSSLCSLTILKIWTQVVRLGFEKFSVEIVFLRPLWTKGLRLRHRSVKTLPARSHAHSFFPLWDCLWFVALWPSFFRLKICFGQSDPCTVSYSVARVIMALERGYHNRTFTTEKGIWWHFIGSLKPHFILDYNIARIFAYSNSIARACFMFPLTTLMTSINYISSSCELSNPPKTSPKCIHNLTVDGEALTMCFRT